ncbi:hypothetical protein CEXT_338511 [Caerostris extrusa]|uniref:Uncharacterized protein n=1 Tax=Caerostris extrusa TaxID=172846 RepID=A0AAV4WKC8_CAEEX|nr:hypothetical protein CEXT_338511 [Caerostris extrusa]
MVWWLWKTDLWNTSINKEIKGKGVMDRGKWNKGREWYCFGSHRRWSFVELKCLLGNAFRQSGKLSHKIHPPSRLDGSKKIIPPRYQLKLTEGIGDEKSSMVAKDCSLNSMLWGGKERKRKCTFISLNGVVAVEDGFMEHECKQGNKRKGLDGSKKIIPPRYQLKLTEGIGDERVIWFQGLFIELDALGVERRKRKCTFISPNGVVVVEDGFMEHECKQGNKRKGVMDRGKWNKGREWYCFGSHRRWSFVGVEVLVGNAFRQSGKLSHKIHLKDLL